MYAKQHDRILNAIMDLVTSPTNIAWPTEPENILVGPGGGGVGIGPRQGINPDAARRLADALCMREQRLEHSGTISVTGSLPREDRGYAPHTGASNLKPVPPVNPPSVVRGLIEVENQPDGDSDKRGENGYSFYSKGGIVRSDGETWILKAGKVVTSASVTDARTSELASGVRQLHDYVDCFECSDKKGRDTTDTPVRVFNDYPGALRTTDVIHYARDLNGLAYQVGPNPDARYGIVQSGYDNKSVYDGAESPTAVTLKACDSKGLNTTGAIFTSKVLKRANKDPALFTDYVVAYIADDEGSRVVISDCYDKPIVKSIEIWNGTSSTIKDGWSLCDGSTITIPDGSTPVTTLNLNNTFIMGITTDALVGTTGGSHPIRPWRHDDSDPSSTTATWFGTWKDSAWKLDEHASSTSSTSETGIAVDNWTGGSGSTSLTITGDTGTRSLTIAAHPDHHHLPTEVEIPFDNVLGTSDVIDLGNDDFEVAEVWGDARSSTQVNISGGAITLDHTVDPESHDHGAGSLVVSPSSHSHSTTHTHTTTDPGHFHTSPKMSHTGSLWHREEDYRPPFTRLPYIQRTH